MTFKKNERGFTLIELLVVIAIIALLAAILLVALNTARQRSRDAARVSQANQIATALELYFNDKNSYPATTATELGATGASALCSTGWATACAATDTVYAGKINLAPAPNGTAGFHYTQNSSTSYKVNVTLEKKNAGSFIYFVCTENGCAESATP